MTLLLNLVGPLSPHRYREEVASPNRRHLSVPPRWRCVTSKAEKKGCQLWTTMVQLFKQSTTESSPMSKLQGLASVVGLSWRVVMPTPWFHSVYSLHWHSDARRTREKHFNRTTSVYKNHCSTTFWNDSYMVPKKIKRISRSLKLRAMLFLKT